MPQKKDATKIVVQNWLLPDKWIFLFKQKAPKSISFGAFCLNVGLMDMQDRFCFNPIFGGFFEKIKGD